MRGNRVAALTGGLTAVSIPAYAGEPCCRVDGGADGGVYPRVCGGTVMPLAVGQAIEGLSPRMRGNLYHAGTGCFRFRSIPAYAGEPRRIAGRIAAPQVYPRVCGGTTARCCRTAITRGLSPRMRGNRCCCAPPRARNGSIPAYAGEPMSSGPMMSPTGVYPRVCGGTPPQFERGG